MVHALVVAAVAWPLLLGAAAWRASSGESSAWAAVTYAAAGLVCHQQPARSFHTAGTQWPVCARCSGLYLAAPLGAVFALAGRRRLTPAPARTVRVLGVAALPSLAVWLAELSGAAPVGNVTRAAAALPLGAAVAFVLVQTAALVGPRGARRAVLVD
jgi:uncharacterized membrane protein